MQISERLREIARASNFFLCERIRRRLLTISQPSPD